MEKKEDSLIIKSCYSHIGGKFGLALTDQFIKLGWIVKDEGTRNFLITRKGLKEFTKLGVNVNDI